jgi:DNA helicase II / ATP-dependent DNA helicase PcrA
MKFNHQQEAIINYYGTPQVVIAGAGTGKTTVMIQKIKHLIAEGHHAPHNILALTFTNKAANEMKERFASLSNTQTQPFFGTFHSFCLQFLKKTPFLDSVGLPKNFAIIDHSQQKETIQKLIKSNNITIGRSVKDTLSKISAIKQFPHTQHAELLSDAPDDIQALFTPYNQYLQKTQCVDFDDLILHTYFILSTQSDALSAMHKQYEYLIIDEYQDTNAIQNDLCILLAQAHQNICVVGDFDQTIYSWRGANVKNLLDFNQYFPTAVTQKLEINYRSTKEILSSANQLIEHNTQRTPKSLTTDRSNNISVEHIICYNEREESEHIANTIKELQKKHQYPLSDFAILYRTNQQSRAIEETLIHYNLPHKIVGTTPFYQRMEIKNAVAYLHCLNNINNPIWFERAMLNPARGVGKTSIQNLIAFATSNDLLITEAIAHPDSPLKARYTTIISDFIATIQKVQAESLSIEEKLTTLLEQVHYEESLGKLENHADRIDNVNELKTKCQQVTDLESFLNDITLFQGSDDAESTDQIHCLTLHLAKGLEFKVVFIPGFEDELLPLRNTNNLEEERRLAYVGITRGKDHVYLLSTYKRTLMGDDWYHAPSLFSSELIGTVSVSLTSQARLFGQSLIHKLKGAGIEHAFMRQPKKDKPVINAVKENFTVFSTGDVIYHPTLGTGAIQSTSGDGDALMYSIAFPTGKKTLMAKFAPIQSIQ